MQLKRAIAPRSAHEVTVDCSAVSEVLNPGHDLSSQRVRAAQITKRRRNKLREKCQGLDSWSNNTVECRRHLTGSQLIQQARRLGRRNGRRDFTIANRSKISGQRIEGTRSGIASELNRSEEIHLEDLLCHLVVVVWLDAVDPVVRKLLLDEERCYRREVWTIASVAIGEELVEE